MMHALYLNGLGSGKTRKREQLAFNYLAKHGIEATHASIDWHAGESFDDIFARLQGLARQMLIEHDELILIGSSAGGSMAVNIAGLLRSPNLYVISLSGRINEQPIPWWDKRNLHRMSHLDSKMPCQAFYDSVIYCTHTTVPRLTQQDRSRIVTVRQWADFVVPRATMTIPGSREHRVIGLGHGWGIAMGVRQLPRIIEDGVSLCRP